MGAYYELFDGSNDIKIVGLFLDESLEYIYGTSLDLYEIIRGVNAGVIRNVSRGVVSGVGSSDGAKLER